MPDISDRPQRLIALGASNLTRGFSSLVSAAGVMTESGAEVFAALGHGRSYGAGSRFAWRVLPGILQSGLWAGLEKQAPLLTRALITDVGNDLLYGFGTQQTLIWVKEAVRRLKEHTDDIVITDLPLHSIRRLSEHRFRFFRTVLVPSCRLSLHELLDHAERLNAGLAEIAEAQGLRSVRLRSEWYGLDPIHIRSRFWQDAWAEIAGFAPPFPAPKLSESLRLYCRQPERRVLFGREQLRSQNGQAALNGVRIFLY